jgi:predicted ATPase
MLRSWGDVAKGRSRVIVVEGEAGIGKTRLADDFSRWLRANGASVLRTRAFEAGLTVPFGSVLEILRAALRIPGVAGTDPGWLAEVSRLVPEIRRQFPAVPEPRPTPGHSLLFEAVSELLLAAADDHPIAILVDDLQWCDPDSCTMLHYLTRRLEAAPVLWCVTVTVGGLERDAAAARLARALRGGPSSTRIELIPMSADEVWSLIRERGRITTATAGRRLSARIHEVTGGNPFYVIELLKTLFAQGWLTLHSDTKEWILAPGPSGELDVGTMSPTVQEAIAQRVAHLPDDLHAILMSIALAGRGCSTSVLSHIHGISRLRSAAIGDALVDRQFAVEEHGLYRCAHPVIASAVRAEMTTARRREIHRAIALALIASAEEGSDRADPGEIALHAEQGGEQRLAYDHALAASRASSERSAFEEALAWLDLASSCAQGPDQIAATDRATAALLEAAGWPEPPPAPRRSGPVAISRRDFDLSGA